MSAKINSHAESHQGTHLPNTGTDGISRPPVWCGALCLGQGACDQDSLLPDYRVRKQSLSLKKDLKPLLVVAKKSRKYAWLKEADSIALQQAVVNLEAAFKNFFNPKLPAKFPRYKSKHGKQSSYHCMSVSVGTDWVKVPKCDLIKASVHRPTMGTVKSITLSKAATGKYYAAIIAEDGRAEVKPTRDIRQGSVIG